jgi:hypothetical protein
VASASGPLHYQQRSAYDDTAHIADMRDRRGIVTRYLRRPGLRRRRSLVVKVLGAVLVPQKGAVTSVTGPVVKFTSTAKKDEEPPPSDP